MASKTWAQINQYWGKYLSYPVVLVVKAWVSIASLWMIYRAVARQSAGFVWHEWQTSWLVPIGVVLLLMPLNWWLEARKWRLLLPNESLTDQQALETVLRGLALNWVLPFTTGDAASRLAPLQNKTSGIWALLANRTSLLLVTAAFGVYGVSVYLKGQESATMWMTAALPVCWAGWYFLFRKKVPVAHQLMALTLLRYAVFTLQFWMLLYTFLPHLPTSILLAGIGWIYLFRTFLPALLGNFGVREASALVFFEPLVAQASLILLPCLLIWLINTVLPSLLGLVVLLRNGLAWNKFEYLTHPIVPSKEGTPLRFYSPKTLRTTPPNRNSED